MKLLRIGPAGHEKPCILDQNGRARDLSDIIPDFTAETLPRLPELLRDLDPETLPGMDQRGERVGPPVRQPENIYCIGLNYSDHAKEAGMPIPEEPILFSKAASAYCGPNDPVRYSPEMSKLDWEVELGVFIGQPTFRVDEEDALNHVAGYCVVNDVSERAWQLEHGGQWMKGKSYPNFCPTGPWLVTPDDVSNPQDLALELRVNGTLKQSGTTARMIFDVAKIISYLSQFMQLEPGDLICTGTPPGVGMGRTPPEYLQPGDRVDLSVEGLGEQSQVVSG